MKKRASYILLLTLLVISTFVVGCSKDVDDQSATSDQHYIPVEVERVNEETIANKVNLNGKIYADNELMIMPQMPGTVTSVNVKLGDFVHKDEVLFVMDQKDINRSIEQSKHGVDLALRGVDQAENGMRSAKIQYESTKERYEAALSDLERTRTLYEAGAVSKTQLEQAEMAASSKTIEAAEAQVRQSEIGYQQALNQLSQAESGYAQVKSNLDNTLVKAPISGVVSSLNVVEGHLATNAQTAATVVDLDNIYLRVDIAENLVNKLFKGQEVVISIASALDETITGVIDYISPTADPRTQLYSVKVYIPNTNNKVKPGMSGIIQIDLESRQDVLTVRSGAILDKEGEKIIYLVKDDYAVEQKVTIGLDTGLYVEITEGLQEGATVITKGQHYVADGQRVKVVRGE
ncbi:efflux RND transporter periplasmic adaptor subunit [Alkaliphilus peptidifermentans]|uniref:RND family efflux transporter, MFP subunit n=1 Tax=Alkaliphilus peptidifermentans DSM 18978 TaxID=1120976 RepID=A0A1G5F0W3_9FIRM|nr:efflux RND transporter periplasmic adaptor subunit [Alkaliphilus peptidifermentans]SCY32308.1 RND family efflux transporter, MFP subunit [Alkaliphilus peptidifermentans DSM 18978]